LDFALFTVRLSFSAAAQSDSVKPSINGLGRPGMTMDSLSTLTTLLSRVRNPGDHQAWREFEARYRPLLVRFCRRRGLQLTDAEDVVQMVFAGLAQTLPGFAYDPQRGRFRDYLFRCMRNALFRWSQRPGRGDRGLDTDVAGAAPDPREAAPDEVALWEEEWLNHHYRLALHALRGTVGERSIAIFERLVAGESVASVAQHFEASVDAVHKVAQRLRARMQHRIAEQIAEEDAV
jgi:RNA polymerase sigma-70 factor (ECF subfamily)